MDRKTILSIEDNETDRRLIREALEPEGYQLHQVSSGEEALELLEDLQPDLILLDLMLPGMDGLATCRQIRSFSSAPLIMLTAKAEEVDRVIGLELGADDYLGKPFGTRELIARVRAMLRRVALQDRGAPPQKHLSFPGLEIDATSRRVVVQGDEVAMTPKEFDLLYYLAARPDQVCRREKLMEKVWGYIPEDMDMRTVDTHVKRLRKKLEESHQVKWSIATIWGVGYRFQP